MSVAERMVFVVALGNPAVTLRESEEFDALPASPVSTPVVLGDMAFTAPNPPPLWGFSGGMLPAVGYDKMDLLPRLTGRVVKGRRAVRHLSNPVDLGYGRVTST
jgi:hypothetical protein